MVTAVDPCGFGLAACSGGGTSHAGSFNFETSAVNSGTITIDLTAKNGTTWADAVAVLTANSDGWEAADNMSGSPQALGYNSASRHSPSLCGRPGLRRFPYEAPQERKAISRNGLTRNV